MDFAADDIELPMNFRPRRSPFCGFTLQPPSSLIVVVVVAAAREIINFPAADTAAAAVALSPALPLTSDTAVIFPVWEISGQNRTNGRTIGEGEEDDIVTNGLSPFSPGLNLEFALLSPVACR